MSRLFIVFTLLVAAATAGCKKDAVTEQCVQAAKAYVAAPDKRSPASGELLTKSINLCPMACKRGEKEACDADDSITVALCDLEGKAACQRMCDQDKNAKACEKVKGM